MADRVIIAGTSRARQDISISDIKQMIGRAGRKIGEEGVVDIFLDEPIERFTKRYKEESNKSIESVLGKDTLAFHIVSMIGEGISREKIKSFFDRSYSTHCGNDLTKQIDKSIDILIEHGVLDSDGMFLYATKYSNLASSYYFHPFDVCVWEANFEEVFGLGLEDDSLVLSWALGNVGHYSVGYYDLRKFEPLEEIQYELDSRGLCYEGNITKVILWYSIFGGPSKAMFSNDRVSLCQDASRIFGVLGKLFDNENGKRMEILLSSLRVMVKHRVGVELVPYFEVEGMTKSRAMEMYYDGI